MYKDQGQNEGSTRYLFVDMMMNEMDPPEEEKDIPWKHGAVNFGYFMVFGIVPLIGYAIFIISASTIHPLTHRLTLFLMRMLTNRNS